MVLSYLTLRKLVGWLGILLPVILVIGVCLLGSHPALRGSISAYYGTVMRGVFVGILFAIGVFLFSYRGYERIDNIAGYAACAFAIGVALFPSVSTDIWVERVHFASAALLFLVLAYFSLYLFTKTGGNKTAMKRNRNKIYQACGVIILVCIALIPIYYWLFEDSSIAVIKPVFWLETFALWAFGASWLIKGETLLKDRPTDTGPD